MKKLLTLGVVVLSLLTVPTLLQASAAGAGFYFGIQLGEGDPGYKTSDINKIFSVPPAALPLVNASSKSSSGDIVARLLTGYNYNDYIGGEIGAAIFRKVDVSATVPGMGKVTLDGQQIIIDLTGKVMLPMSFGASGFGFGVYAKGGLAYMLFDGDFKATNMAGTSLGKDNKKENEFAALYGVGVSAILNEAFVIDISWTEYKAEDKLGDADLIAVGITYHFLERNNYCGEVLC